MRAEKALRAVFEDARKKGCDTTRGIAFAYGEWKTILGDYNHKTVFVTRAPRAYKPSLSSAARANAYPPIRAHSTAHPRIISPHLLPFCSSPLNSLRTQTYLIRPRTPKAWSR